MGKTRRKPEIGSSSRKNENVSDVGLSEGGHLSDREKNLFQEVPENGDAIGNKALRKKLGWADEDYWLVRNELVDKGYVMSGRGRGGSVFRLKEITEATREVS